MSLTSSEMLNSEPINPVDGGLGVVAPSRLAESTYQSLRGAGLSDTDIMAFAGELLSLVAAGFRAAPDTEL